MVDAVAEEGYLGVEAEFAFGAALDAGDLECAFDDVVAGPGVAGRWRSDRAANSNRRDRLAYRCRAVLSDDLADRADQRRSAALRDFACAVNNGAHRFRPDGLVGSPRPLGIFHCSRLSVW